jgi:hypothetical protein
MLISMQFRRRLSLRGHSQLARRSMNDQWGESTRLGYDELCTSA